MKKKILIGLVIILVIVGGIEIAITLSDGPKNNPSKPQTTETAKEGYVFKGWFTSNSYMTEFDFSIPIVADLVLYAKWDEEPIDPNAITYIVHFVTDCLIVIEDKIVVEGKLLGKPTPPVREEYRFGGWFLDYDFKQEYLFDTPVMSILLCMRNGKRL